MSINKIIRDALLPLGVPVSYLVHTGTATTYIVFSFYDERAALKADDEEVKTRHCVQMDVYGKGDIEQLTKDAKNALEAIGCVRNSYFEDFEEDTKLYHKAYRFYYDIQLGE